MNRLEPKHPRAIRWMHWINFPVLVVMIWSGSAFGPVACKSAWPGIALERQSPMAARCRHGVPFVLLRSSPLMERFKKRIRLLRA
jgi:hypothetical protein